MWYLVFSTCISVAGPRQQPRGNLQVPRVVYISHVSRHRWGSLASQIPDPGLGRSTVTRQGRISHVSTGIVKTLKPEHIYFAYMAFKIVLVLAIVAGCHKLGAGQVLPSAAAAAQVGPPTPKVMYIMKLFYLLRLYVL
jgi:hypothetical protein